eukprot:CAMPEP_0176368166 /NCGR_PEP_ID=MMETSP0126-20121128/22407_1 /TAXON_ID=141414 ORGANISM="Strombidinopsis acuminatum, Strain SPMC142" /NCGR_SAMPLE_ID=MMETSP0126 /ASSEMBLY_ACC=CAM_ASM_000229 /LENGTH=44 /DNA_ID= /DNA_START= /DNA_END= /DNA_ORIENTATION=
MNLEQLIEETVTKPTDEAIKREREELRAFLDTKGFIDKDGEMFQ